MEDITLLNLWKSYESKLEDNLQLNRRNALDLTQIKLRSLLSSMRPIKVFTIVAGILWVALVDMIIVGSFQTASLYFLISAIAQVLLTKVAIGIYLYQLILISGVSIHTPVLQTQAKLARLQSSTMLVTRVLLLQLPFWTTFYWNKSMWENGNVVLIILQLLITLLFTYIALWLFRNIHYGNKDKKWFRVIFEGKEWTPVLKSFDLIDQIKEYAPEVKTEKAKASV
jgi:hypothetical protein